MDDNKLLKLALDTGEAMLSGGAETHRVEDTMRRILATSHSEGVEAQALNTMLIVSIPSKEKGSLTLSRGIRKRSTNFEKICFANDLSRAFVSGEITLDDAAIVIAEVKNLPSFDPRLTTLCYGIAGASFCLVLGGVWLDGLISFALSFFIGFLLWLAREKNIPYCFTPLFGGFIAALGTSLFALWLPLQIDLVIIGSITPMLPGVTISNSVRDIMESNFISGTSKLAEACLIAASIACGVAFGLSILG
ncbi:threonine/serine exporter family protein [Chakrabartyella piscis]|uniref:threonine/serine ThrE exporter family protein n=1 Tax=Chakrabartyella piscis TaxID=2918914 RepID=UPI002958862E|nr:threonine/serine exporter family protein [Chakrabartyella piscis]